MGGRKKSNNILIILSVSIIFIIILSIYFFTQQSGRGEITTCPWIFKTSFEYDNNPFAQLNDEGTMIIAASVPSNYSQFLKTIPKTLSNGYLWISRSGCSAKQVKHELYNPRNLAFFNMTFEEYVSMLEGKEEPELSKRIPNPISELYICDPDLLEEELMIELRNRSAYITQIDKIIQEGALDSRCEKII